MARRLPNYLRTYRKRAGLSQDEVAFLLGYQSGTRVSRYECFGRQPELETALAYEAISGVPARELFAGMYEEIEAETRKRAGVLARKLAAAPASADKRKLELLQKVAAGSLCEA